MSSSVNSPMAGYEKEVFTAPIESGSLVSHDVYSRGCGPVVVIIQELPGIGSETLRLADSFVDQGFSVILPHLFGPLGKTSMLGNLARVFCMRREFALFSKNRCSPVVDWLKALCRHQKDKRDVGGVGVIGMCLTGNFAISLMADESVLAAVASQPSMPVHDQNAIHMSEEEVRQISARLEEHGPMLAYRIAGDKICRAEKFTALDGTFNKSAERMTLKTLPGKGHSVLTLDFVNEAGHPTRKALDEILEYFTQKLNSGQTRSSPEPAGV